MKTYIVKFKENLNLYTVIAGNAIDAIGYAIADCSTFEKRGYSSTDVEIVGEKHLTLAFLNNEN